MQTREKDNFYLCQFVKGAKSIVLACRACLYFVNVVLSAYTFLGSISHRKNMIICFSHYVKLNSSLFSRNVCTAASTFRKQGAPCLRWLNKRVLILLQIFFLNNSEKNFCLLRLCILFRAFFLFPFKAPKENHREEMFCEFMRQPSSLEPFTATKKSSISKRSVKKKVSWQLLCTHKKRNRAKENPKMTTKYHRLWKYSPDAKSGGESRQKKSKA